MHANHPPLVREIKNVAIYKISMNYLNIPVHHKCINNRYFSYIIILLNEQYSRVTQISDIAPFAFRFGFKTEEQKVEN